MTRKLLALVHFSPIELYPPVQNLLNELSKEELKVYVFTTSNKRFAIDRIPPVNRNIVVKRISKITRFPNWWMRTLRYTCFYGYVFLLLLIKRPRKVLYFETLSSLPVCLYKRLVGRNTSVFAHYHEYTSPSEYGASILENFMHQVEVKLYPVFSWISHTNEERMRLFEKDCQYEIPEPVKQIVPNYPPKSWRKSPANTYHTPLRVVYVGALSLTSMYTKEFVEWVLHQRGAVAVDFFAYNYSSDAKNYLSQVNCPFVKLHPGVPYHKLPEILGQYDVGLILYNGHIPNYIFCAPNKLFEYLACGLDVWFPSVMYGTQRYVTDFGRPKVTSLDFDNLSKYQPQDLLCVHCEQVLTSYSSESALRPLIKKLTDA